MKTYKVLLILICLVHSNFTIAQKKKNDQPVLKVENREKDRFSPTIKAQQFLKLKLVNQDQLVKGYYTAFTDSTLSLADTVVSFKDIEVIYATNRGGIRNGIILMGTGGLITASGFAFFFNQTPSDLIEAILVTMASALLVGSGGYLALTGGVVVLFSTHTYDTEKWNLYVSYPEDRKKIKKL
ncbi:MAG: hypothetical protein IT222_00305 [Crocinitomix sp.]|nr:hypothetical protein [Crocinitomix sp.]